MTALALFTMKGRMQAALVAAVTLILAFIFPPFAWVSSAVIALVTLRRGVNEGVIVAAIAIIGASGLGYAALGSPTIGFWMALTIWIPTLILAIVLRISVKLEYSFYAATLIAVLLVVGLFVVLGDPAAHWLSMFKLMFQDATFPAEFGSPEEIDRFLGVMAQMMTGAMGATLFYSQVLGLLLARYWQAALYNPEGFRKEYHGLRLSKTSALIALAVIAGSFALNHPFLTSLAIVVMALYLFQGLAVIHGIVRQCNLKRTWLIVVYVMLVVFSTQMILLLASIGIVDAWGDFRNRFCKGNVESE